jgi:cytochrome c553
MTAALTLVFASSAFANFGPHGGYVSDTDSCAGCHRAHTSFSNLRYDPRVGADLLAEDEKPYALLVGNAATMSEFCNACHGDTAPGASTNVVSGRFDSGPSGAAGQAAGTSNGGVTVAYETASTFNAPLNGGGFSTTLNYQDWEASATPVYQNITSSHSMERVGVLWGAGFAADTNMTLTCTSCHDPHGSSNYRLLKDNVNNHAVGGYTGDNPNGMVFSNEAGYPTADGGWLKHQAGHDQMVAYTPNYTSGSRNISAGTAGASLSTWCSACHEQYDDATSNYSYGTYEGAGAVGSQSRHRHPVDISPLSGDANLQIAAMETVDARIPLEVVGDGSGNPRANHIGCLTCHYAHGSSSQMSGWAMSHLEQSGARILPVRDTVAGVDPDKADVIAALNGGSGISGTSALLRANNRGVCERCHNK